MRRCVTLFSICESCADGCADIFWLALAHVESSEGEVVRLMNKWKVESLNLTFLRKLAAGLTEADELRAPVVLVEVVEEDVGAEASGAAGVLH